jgi:hypothetical protein
MSEPSPSSTSNGLGTASGKRGPRNARAPALLAGLLIGVVFALAAYGGAT